MLEVRAQWTAVQEMVEIVRRHLLEETVNVMAVRSVDAIVNDGGAARLECTLGEAPKLAVVVRSVLRL